MTSQAFLPVNFDVKDPQLNLKSKMTDSDSSSESETSACDFSDFEEAIGGDEPVNEVELFCCLQPWRFGPSGRAVEAQERERGRYRTSAPPM